jgi:REP element-mobilizing transposase RayT
MMRRSKIEVYVHMVWAVADRAELVKGALRRVVYRCIEGEYRRKGCTVLAIGGMPDHVHVLACMPATVRIYEIARDAKGVSSHMVGEHPKGTGAFAWQSGYGAFSVSKSDVPRIIAYIERQEEHHTHGTTAPDLEETDEEAPSECASG